MISPAVPPPATYKGIYTFPSQNQGRIKRTHVYTYLEEPLSWYGYFGDNYNFGPVHCDTAAPKLVVTKLRTRTGPTDQLQPRPNKGGGRTCHQQLIYGLDQYSLL